MHWSLIFYFFMHEHEPGIKAEVLGSFENKLMCENRLTEIALNDKFIDETGREYQLKLNKNSEETFAYFRDKNGSEEGLICVQNN